MMSASAQNRKDFQIDFLKFLKEKNVSEVHIYHHIMNYWSNDSSMNSLQSIKEAITDLCEKNFITSKNNGHLLIGVQGISEEEQKNNAVCTIQKAGIAYIKQTDNIRNAKNAFVVLLIVGILFSLWHYRKMIVYFFK